MFADHCHKDAVSTESCRAWNEVKMFVHADLEIGDRSQCQSIVPPFARTSQETLDGDSKWEHPEQKERHRTATSCL